MRAYGASGVAEAVREEWIRCDAGFFVRSLLTQHRDEMEVEAGDHRLRPSLDDVRVGTTDGDTGVVRFCELVESPQDEFEDCGGALSLECFLCGRRVPLETNGRVLRAATPCWDGAKKPWTLELNVPSGLIGFANDLRDRYPVSGSYDVNTLRGRFRTAKQYERRRCLHVFVGNTCPGIWRHGNKLWVGDRERRVRGEDVGGVCTDLWWLCAVDLDDFLAKGGTEGELECVVPVDPGVYRFEYRYHLLGERKRGVYVRGRRDRDCGEVAHDDWPEMQRTAGQVLHRSMRDWSDSHLPDGDGLRLAVGRLLFGQNHSIHPNGWWTMRAVPVDEPEVEVPRYDGRLNWFHVLDEHSAVCQAATMNESFRKLAENVLGCVARNGMVGVDGRSVLGHAELAMSVLERLAVAPSGPI